MSGNSKSLALYIITGVSLLRVLEILAFLLGHDSPSLAELSRYELLIKIFTFSGLAISCIGLMQQKWWGVWSLPITIFLSVTFTAIHLKILVLPYLLSLLIVATVLIPFLYNIKSTMFDAKNEQADKLALVKKKRVKPDSLVVGAHSCYLFSIFLSMAWFQFLGWLWIVLVVVCTVGGACLMVDFDLRNHWRLLFSTLMGFALGLALPFLTIFLVNTHLFVGALNSMEWLYIVVGVAGPLIGAWYGSHSSFAKQHSQYERVFL